MVTNKPQLIDELTHWQPLAEPQSCCVCRAGPPSLCQPPPPTLSVGHLAAAAELNAHYSYGWGLGEGGCQPRRRIIINGCQVCQGPASP